MAVPKTTETRCRDRAYKHCTNNPIPTSFLHVTSFLHYALKLLGNKIVHEKRYNIIGMGLFVQCLYTLSLATPTLCGFWHCHSYFPLHFSIYLLVSSFAVNSTIGGC